MKTAALNAISQICALKNYLSKTGFQMQTAFIQLNGAVLIKLEFTVPAWLKPFYGRDNKQPRWECLGWEGMLCLSAFPRWASAASGRDFSAHPACLLMLFCLWALNGDWKVLGGSLLHPCGGIWGAEALELVLLVGPQHRNSGEVNLFGSGLNHQAPEMFCACSAITAFPKKQEAPVHHMSYFLS